MDNAVSLARYAVICKDYVSNYSRGMYLFIAPSWITLSRSPDTPSSVRVIYLIIAGMYIFL